MESTLKIHLSHGRRCRRIISSDKSNRRAVNTFGESYRHQSTLA
jgi:hypothetical protein